MSGSSMLILVTIKGETSVSSIANVDALAKNIGGSFTLSTLTVKFFDLEPYVLETVQGI